MERLEGAKATHKAVLLSEAVEFLHIQKGDWYIDATAGAGGYSKAILEKGGRVLALDADRKAVRVTERELRNFCDDQGIYTGYKVVQGNFRDVAAIASREGLSEVAGVVFDLGISSIQLAETGRGFSFEDKESKLDMRLDQDSQSVSAADLLYSLRQDQLEVLFAEVMNRAKARRLAREAVAFRESRRIERVRDMVELVERSGFWKGKLRAPTLAFLALRIAVNSEIESLRVGLEGALEVVRRGGRLVVVSFHSGEDRVVKGVFGGWDADGRVKVLTKQPVRPCEDEIKNNVRSRSARLRTVEKI